MIDNQTPHYALPLPHPENLLGEDVLRLRAALTAIDACFRSDRDALASHGDSLGELAGALAAEALARQQALTALGAQKVSQEAQLPGGIDLNTVTTSGFYRFATGTTHGPVGDAYLNNGQMVVAHGGGDTIVQLAAPFAVNDLWLRTGVLGTTHAQRLALRGWTQLSPARITSVAYDASSGRVASYTEDGVAHTLDYDSAGRVTANTWPCGNGRTQQDTIAYNAAGQVIGVTRSEY